MRYILLKLLLLFFPVVIQAQYYIVGQDPSNIKWRQINSPNFQIIYPSDFEHNAQRMANILEKVYIYAGKTLNHQPSKISVILHTQTVRSNGFAAWAPSRVEMFTVPHQDIYAQDWLEQLAIHEFRHVVQIDKIGSELPKIFKILLGEQAAAIAIAAYLPFWFLEGDAVVTETAISYSGRGRLPSFEMELKAQVQEKGLYSYDKAYLGSYRDYIPDYYQLGYQIVAGGRSRYGDSIWGNVLQNVARKPLSLNAFSKGLKNVAQVEQVQLYKESLSRFKDEMKEENKINLAEQIRTINKEHNSYTTYSYPHFVNDSTFIALKSSISDISRFVKINSKGEETIVFTPGTISEQSVSYDKDRIIWIETKPDGRWSHKESSLLRIINIKSGEKFEKNFSEKLYVPKFSPDGKFISLVMNDFQNRCYLVMISPDNGQIIHETRIPDQFLLLTPSWSEDGKSILGVLLGPDGKSLVRFDPYKTEFEYLIPFTYTEIKKPVQKSGFVYFTSNLNGTDNGFALNLDDKKLFQVTNSKFGIKDLQVSESSQKFIYSDYSSDGFNIVVQPNNNDFRKERSWAEKAEYPLAEKISAQESIIDFKNNGDSTIYPSKAYKKWKNILNFHSWSPVYIDADNVDIQPGFSLMSQNKLSTALTQLGYKYSTTDKTGKLIAKFQYSGLYPIFDLNVEYGKGKSQYYQITKYQNSQGQIVKIDTTLVGFTYDQLYVNGGVKLPVNFTYGKMYRLLQPEFQIGYTQIWQHATTPESIFQGTVIPFTYRLYLHNLLRQSHRDLQPKFGQVIDLQFRHTPTGNRDLGSIWAAENTFYLPGFARNHGIRFYAGIQHKTSTDYMFSDLILYPRGYESVSNTEMFTLRSDYVLPLFYPDLSIGKLIYMKRFSTRLFYDYSFAKVPISASNEYVNSQMSSVGGEFYIDCHFLRFLAPAKIGFRESYLLENKNFFFEALLSINLNDL